jgi:hypothetical protein
MDTLEKELRTDMITEINYQVEVDKLWRTSISNITVLTPGSLKFKITRPDSGDAKGGYVYLYEDVLGGNPIVREYYAGNASGDFTVKSDKIDLYNGHYVLGYGPHYTDNVNIIATTVQLDNGNAYNLESSVCSPISHSINEVTSFYSFARNVLGFSHYASMVTIREGGILGKGNQVGVTQISTDANNKGTVILSNLKLSYGKTYNVCINLYSSVRPVAGYSFTLQG